MWNIVALSGWISADYVRAQGELRIAGESAIVTVCKTKTGEEMILRRYRLTVVVFLFVALSSWLLPALQTDAADSFSSLVAQIETANSRSGNTTITLTEDITLSAALPPITGDMTIEGRDHTISGDRLYRIFDVNGGTLVINSLTLTGGKAEQGGAIRLRNGAGVAIEGSTLRGNTATNGGAIATSSGSDRLNVSDSKFMDNIAEERAGAIYANGGVVKITGGSFVKNCAQFAFYALDEGRNSERRSVDADGCLSVRYVRSQIDTDLQSDVDGGAIRLLNGAQASVEGSTFSENSATYGGAISTASKNVRLSVTNSSFVGNRASGSGGAIAASWLGGGSISIKQ